MAHVNFTTTSWSAFIGTPNKLVNELGARFTDVGNILNQDPISDSSTSTSETATFANGGTGTITGTNLDSVFPTISFIGYSDPAGNSASLVCNLSVNYATGSVSGGFSSVSLKFSGIEVSAAGDFNFSSLYGSGSASISSASLKVSGWTFAYGGNFSYAGSVTSGTFSSLTVTSPQGDSFTISDATLPTPLLNSISSMDFFLTQSFLTGNDVLTSGTKNDVFGGYGGNDTIDGGAGIDTAVYSGNRASYAVTKTGTGFTVADNSGAEGTDTLTNVERLQFADKKLAFDVDGSAGKAAEIVAALFGTQYLQTKEYVGLGISLFDSGQTMEQVAQLALGAGLFKQLAGSSSNTDFVKLVYGNVTGAAPSTSDLGYFVHLLDTGAYAQASLAAAAAQDPLNTAHIGLVGLGQTGIEFT